MAIIGIDDETGLNSGDIDNTTTQVMVAFDAGSPYVYVAPANEEVFRVGYYCGVYSGDVDGVELALLDVDSGNDGATVVPGTITQLSSLTANSWNVLDFTAVALTTGRSYVPARRIRSATNVTEFSQYVSQGTSVSASDGSVAIVTPWVEDAVGGGIPAMYFESRTASGPVENVGLTDTAFDENNAPLLNETNIEVVVYDTFGGTELYQTATASTDGSGVLVIDDDAVGNVSDTVDVAMRRSNGHTVYKTMTVVDLNA